MKSELKEISPSQKEIHLEIDADVVKASYAKISRKYADKASIPGFRKGYAPVDVVRIRFKDDIKNDVLQDIIPGQVTAAIEHHDLQPLTEPHLHLEEPENVNVNGTEPVKLHIHVEVMPELPEPVYEGFEVTRRVRPVEDAELEGLIAERLQREAALVPVEGRASQIGDTVMADLVGTFEDDPDAEPITADDVEVTLGDDVIEKAFSENLIGVSQDEEKEFTVAYADDSAASGLAGKTIHYKAKIKSVGVKEQPELNDEWVKSLDEGFESLADLRTKLRADLEKVSEADADSQVRNELVAKLLEENEFDVPSSLIENQTRNLLNNFVNDLQQRGVDISKVNQEFVQMAYGNMRTQAERDVRAAILLDKVAERENVSVSDADVEEEISTMAAYYRTTPEEIRKSFETHGGGIDSVRNNLKTRRSVEALVAKANVTDGEWVEPAAEQPPAETAEAEEPKKAKKAPAKKAAKKDG